MTHCAFPLCPHPSRARGYCSTHHQQLVRANGDVAKLRPIRARPEEPLATISIRLPQDVVDAVRDDTAGARAALTRWAREGARLVAGRK